RRAPGLGRGGGVAGGAGRRRPRRHPSRLRPPPPRLPDRAAPRRPALRAGGALPAGRRPRGPPRPPRPAPPPPRRPPPPGPPAAIAADMPVAYYFPPADDGSRPGTYFVNTAAPDHKTRYETASVAYHEAIPGHHLQLAIAKGLDGVPTFQRLSHGNTAFVEGWGLYAERLAEEMGLYGDDLERIGMLAADSWRSCRLVVDTGLHALGWARQQAIDFMAANTPVSVGEIEVEVD